MTIHWFAWKCPKVMQDDAHTDEPGQVTCQYCVDYMRRVDEELREIAAEYSRLAAAARRAMTDMAHGMADEILNGSGPLLRAIGILPPLPSDYAKRLARKKRHRTRYERMCQRRGSRKGD